MTTVEMALTMPILFGLLMGSLEFSHVNMVRNSAENAAYEGARRGIVPGATADDVRAAAQRVMSIIGVRNETIRVIPLVIETDTPQVTVEIEIPMDSNGFVAAHFMKGKILKRSCTLNRESLETTSVP